MGSVLVDFETRSKVNLKTAGADRYAADPSTEVVCLAVKDLTTGEMLVYAPFICPPHGSLEVAEKLSEADYIWAHNARFDQLIYEYLLAGELAFPLLPSSKWLCTSALCRVNALPASLDLATRCAQTPHKKNKDGKKLINKISKPNEKTGEFNSFTLAELESFIQYCVDDVEASAALFKALPPMSEFELADYLVNERINDRGVQIDTELAALAVEYAQEEKEEIEQGLMAVSGGVVSGHAQHVRIKNYVLENYSTPELLARMTVEKDGKEKLSFDKVVRQQLLDEAAQGAISLPSDLIKLIELVNMGSKSSVAKFRTMLEMANPVTNRINGALVYAGAGQTKRYSSKGMQLHNMARDCFSTEEAEEIKELMREHKPIPSPVMVTLSKLIRKAIVPAKDNVFVVGDWSAIEGRILPWLTLDPDAEAVLNVFREGGDIYIHTAERMGGSYSRQVGKVAALSLGFGGALGAFMNMGKNYGLILEERKVNAIVAAWRKANPWAKKLWRRLEKAAVNAVANPSVVYTVGRLSYQFNKSEKILYCNLPNGERIRYPKARIKSGMVECIKASHKPKANERNWPTMQLWGGLLAENVTQACAGALLQDVLACLDTTNEPVVMHVHDEVILEVHKDKAAEASKLLQEVMETPPDWAETLPLKAEPEIMFRYGK